MAEAQPLHCLRAHRMEKHVGGINQTPQGILGGILLEIEHKRALVAVQPHIQCRHIGGTLRPCITRGIPGRTFDFHDIGAHVAHCLGRQWSEANRSQIENANAVQWARHLKVLHTGKNFLTKDLQGFHDFFL